MKNVLTILALMLILSCYQDNESMNNLIESEKFLNSNLTNRGVIEIEPGLQYLVLQSSQSGKQPNLDNTITADFHGTLIDGTVFWSSIDLGEPLTIVLSQLIPGCQKAMSRMKEGDSWRTMRVISEQVGVISSDPAVRKAVGAWDWNVDWRG